MESFTNTSIRSSYINTNIENFIEKDYDREFNPISALHPGSPIEFQISGTNIFYISLRDSYFDIQFNVTLPNGNDLPADAPLGPANLLAHSLFSNIEISLNGKQITEPTIHYQYRAYLETLANYSSYVQEKRLIMEGWLLDTPAQFGALSGLDGANLGLVARKVWIHQSRNARLLLRPRLDIFHQDCDLPPNTDVRIRLIPNRDQFYMITNGNVHYRLNIQGIRFWIRTREVSGQCLLNHQQMLHTGLNYRIHMPSIRIKTLSIPTASLRQEFDNLYMGQLPHRIIMAMVLGEHMDGTYGSNPYFFQNFSLNYLVLRVNGELVPRNAYQPDFVNIDYIRDYAQVLNALDLDSSTTNALCLSPSDWANGFSFFAFKLFPNQSQYRPAGSVRLEIRFAVQTPAVINIILLSESTGSIDIDKYKNILIN